MSHFLLKKKKKNDRVCLTIRVGKKMYKNMCNII